MLLFRNIKLNRCKSFIYLALAFSLERSRIMIQTLASHKVVAKNVKNQPKKIQARAGLALTYRAPDKVWARVRPIWKMPSLAHGPRMVGPLAWACLKFMLKVIH